MGGLKSNVILGSFWHIPPLRWEFTRRLRHGTPLLQKAEEVQRIGEEEARCTTRSSETHISEAFQSFFIYHEPQERRQGPRFSIRMIIWISCFGSLWCWWVIPKSETTMLSSGGKTRHLGSVSEKLGSWLLILILSICKTQPIFTNAETALLSCGGEISSDLYST